MSNTPTALLIDRVRPAAFDRYRLSYDVVSVASATAFIALLAQLRFPLPFTPVPVTGQTLAVLLVAAALGRSRAVSSVVAYLVLGALGLPLFTGFGSGLERLAGPTGGYLIGFFPAAVLVGFLAEKGWSRRWLRSLAAMALGSLLIYAFGALWLARFTGLARAFSLGVLPFIPGDLVKVGIATALLPSAWRILGPRD